MNCLVQNKRKHKKGPTKILRNDSLVHCIGTKSEVKKKKETFCVFCVDIKRYSTNRVQLIKFCSINSSNIVSNNEKVL